MGRFSAVSASTLFLFLTICVDSSEGSCGPKCFACTYISYSLSMWSMRKSIAARNVSLRWPIYIFNLGDITKLYLLALSCFSRRRFVVHLATCSGVKLAWTMKTLLASNFVSSTPKDFCSVVRVGDLWDVGCVGICGVLMRCGLCRNMWGINEMWAV